MQTNHTYMISLLFIFSYTNCYTNFESPYFLLKKTSGVKKNIKNKQMHISLYIWNDTWITTIQQASAHFSQ
jgi:hypothetical protein